MRMYASRIQDMRETRTMVEEAWIQRRTRLYASTRIKKRASCLPDEQLTELQVARLFDLEGARAAVAGFCASR